MNRTIVWTAAALVVAAGGWAMAQGNPQTKVDPSKAKELPVSAQIQNVENELKAMKAEIAALKSDNAALKTENGTLKQRVDGLVASTEKLGTTTAHLDKRLENHQHFFEVTTGIGPRVTCKAQSGNMSYGDCTTEGFQTVLVDNESHAENLNGALSAVKHITQKPVPEK